MAHAVGFTVEPIVPGRPGRDVHAASGRCRRGSARRHRAVQLDPEGDGNDVAAALHDLVCRALPTALAASSSRSSASRTIGERADDDDRRGDTRCSWLLKSSASAVGGELVDDPQPIEPGDLPLRGRGTTVGAFRLPWLHGALDRLDYRSSASRWTAPDLSREGKQVAVRLLDDRGAFLLRRSVEDVADALGVSRITVYNYLSAMR